MPKRPADARDRKLDARSWAEDSSKTPPKQARSYAPSKTANGAAPAARASARRGAGMTAQRASTPAGAAAGYSDITARPSSAPAARSRRTERAASPGRKSAAHPPKRHAATRACEKRSRPYVKRGVSKRRANAPLAARDGEAPKRTAAWKRTSARRAAGSVAPKSRIAHRTGRIEAGEGDPANGRARRYPGSAVSAAPGALFE